MSRAVWGWGVGVVVLAGAGGFLLWQFQAGRSAEAAELQRLRQAEQQLQQRLTTAEEQLRALGQPVPGQGSPPSKSGAVAEAALAAARHQVEELASQLHTREEQWRASEAALGALQGTAKESERRAEAAEARVQQAQAAESAWKEKIDELGRQLAALQKSTEGKDARLATLEGAQKVAAAKVEESNRNGLKWRKLADDMEDVARRRETLVTNLSTRYREASDTLRALSLQLENRGAGAASGPNDLSRIQNAVTLAEEDLRQLRSLSARARQLQKELAAAK
jgi:chromosome segregation ATPase